MEGSSSHRFNNKVPRHSRQCVVCHTTKTAQWRLRASDNAILCNACGIKYFRVHRKEDRQKRKPGPKSQAEAEDSLDITTGSGSKRPWSSSHQSSPSKTNKASIDMLLSPNHSHPRSKSNTNEGKSSRAGSSRNHHRSKMDIANLVSPTVDDKKPKGKKY